MTILTRSSLKFRKTPFVTVSRDQKGAAILIITVLLLLITTLATFSIGQVVVSEQKQVGRDVRSKEVYSAAMGGLEYAKDWFADNFNSSITWSDIDCDGCTLGDGISERGDTASVALDNLALNTDSYRFDLTYTLLTDLNPVNGMPVIVRVTSTATAENDAHVIKTLHEEIMIGERAIISKSSSGPFNVLKAPPIMVENCTTGFAGTPDVYLPNATDLAIGSTMGASSGNPSCILPSNIKQNDCLDTACTTSSIVPMQSKFLTPTQTLWQSIFGDITMDELLEIEAQQPERLFIVDDNYPKYAGQPALQNANTWGNDTYGSPTEPVIIIIDKDRTANNCIGIAGGAVIYGLLYYETTAASPSTCSLNGLGHVTIHGTLAKAGDMHKLNANTKIYGQSLDFSGTGIGVTGGTQYDCGLCLPLISEIPGSWRDY